ncbi:Hypothetical protein ADU71_1576 [Pediococcus damnosus]|nr:Hypothetical protein ADU69_1456 [Pediococcus damnosus]AMV65466.1 Hypothetical protein ADU71_1576 [Pediococcus damnosus]
MVQLNGLTQTKVLVLLLAKTVAMYSYISQLSKATASKLLKKAKQLLSM